MLLALETSDRLCAACLMDPVSKAVVASVTLDLGRGHAEKMMDVIADVLAQAGKDYAALSGLAVCVGPGSFTGIRVALATATGLSVALGVPVIGVTALQALALNGSDQIENWKSRPNVTRGEADVTDLRVMSVIDAHRGDVYMQIFGSDLSPLNHPRQISIREAFKEAQALTGYGVLSFGNGFPLLWQEWNAEVESRGIGNLELNPPSILLALEKRAGEIPSVDNVARAALDPRYTVEPKPLYLRKPDAKPQESYTQARALRG